LKEGGMHLTTFESTQDASLEWDHQNPHCFVFMIQSPRRRLVTAWLNMQDERLLVR
jgi:hypothetical protein